MKPDDIKGWLTRDQRDIPYELDFYTPFKEMVQPVRGAHPTEPDSLQGLGLPTSPSSQNIRREDDSHSVPTHHYDSASDSSDRYKRRKRHKVRHDCYEYKGGGKRQQRAQTKARAEIKRRKSQRRDHARGVGHPVAPNVASKRLTLKGYKGIFGNGRASNPVWRRGLPDLAFPERAFRNLSRTWARQDGRREIEQNEGEWHKRDARCQKRLEEKEAEMSRFFQAAEPRISGRDDALQKMMPDRSRFIYETPCRPQRHRQDDELAEVEIELPGKPYLGFGKRGPLLEKPPPRHYTASDGGVSDTTKSRRCSASTSMMNNDKNGHQHSLLPHLETARHYSDPRVDFSPLSNFRFARNQLDETMQTLAAGSQEPQDQCSTAKRMQDMLRLLDLIRVQQARPKARARADRSAEGDTPARQRSSGPEEATDRISARASAKWDVREAGGNTAGGSAADMLDILSRIVDERLTEKLAYCREARVVTAASQDNSQAPCPEAQCGERGGSSTPSRHLNENHDCHQRTQHSPPPVSTDEAGMQSRERTEYAQGCDDQPEKNHAPEDIESQQQRAHVDLQTADHPITRAPSSLAAAAAPAAPASAAECTLDLPSTSFVKPHARLLHSRQSWCRAADLALDPPPFYLWQLQNASGNTHPDQVSASTIVPSDRPPCPALACHWLSFDTAICAPQMPSSMHAAQSRPFSTTRYSAAGASGRPFSQRTCLSCGLPDGDLADQRAFPSPGCRPFSALSWGANALPTPETDRFAGFWRPNTLY